VLELRLTTQGVLTQPRHQGHRAEFRRDEAWLLSSFPGEGVASGYF
jgi:hypothetical protein